MSQEWTQAAPALVGLGVLLLMLILAFWGKQRPLSPRKKTKHIVQQLQNAGPLLMNPVFVKKQESKLQAPVVQPRPVTFKRKSHPLMGPAPTPTALFKPAPRSTPHTTQNERVSPTGFHRRAAKHNAQAPCWLCGQSLAKCPGHED